MIRTVQRDSQYSVKEVCWFQGDDCLSAECGVETIEYS